MKRAVAVLLVSVGTLAFLSAAVMFVGLQVAIVSAGEHADRASFWWTIIPAIAVGVTCYTGAAAVMRP